MFPLPLHAVQPISHYHEKRRPVGSSCVSEYLGRTPITTWWVAHRSDLAFESTESHVPEFRRWLADLWSSAAYFRSSNIRDSEEDIRLHAQNLGREQVKCTTKFVLRNICSTWLMLPLQISGLHADALAYVDVKQERRHRKAQCNGFLKTKQSDSLNWRLTYVVGDLLNQFRQLGLQKEAQKTFITMADLLKQRDQVIQSVDFMVEGISPGCREKKNTSPSIPSKPPMKTTPPSKRAKFNSLVTTSISFESVQKESFSVIETSSRND